VTTPASVLHPGLLPAQSGATTAASAGAAIEIKGLRYRAGPEFSVEDLDLRVPSGAIYGFLGPNGAGKTTTIRLLLGLLKPHDGTISVLGHSMPRDSARLLDRVGYVPERPHLYPSLTVDEALRYHGAFYSRWDAAWALELAAGFALHGPRRIAQLSKGETGKLMIVLALATRPELLVLDEPTDGLDPVVRRDVLSAVLAYVSDHGATVFISSHLVHELERFCDWVGVMDQGRLIAELPMERFKNGLKRLRIRRLPADTTTAPFAVLAREPDESRGDSVLVRGWEPGMSSWLETAGAELREITDLDLEEGFVELLRTFRRPVPGS